jgi:hypothetical protein
MTVRTNLGAPRPKAITAIPAPMPPDTPPADTEANAHRPSAAPTTAVGRPVTGTVTGLGVASTLPAATAVEQPTVNVAVVLCGTVVCGIPEEQPARIVITPIDNAATERR